MRCTHFLLQPSRSVSLYPGTAPDREEDSGFLPWCSDRQRKYAVCYHMHKLATHSVVLNHLSVRLAGN